MVSLPQSQSFPDLTWTCGSPVGTSVSQLPEGLGPNRLQFQAPLNQCYNFPHSHHPLSPLVLRRCSYGLPMANLPQTDTLLKNFQGPTKLVNSNGKSTPIWNLEEFKGENHGTHETQAWWCTAVSCHFYGGF